MADLKELKNRTWGALIERSEPQLERFFSTLAVMSPMEKAAKPPIEFFSTFIPEHVDRAMQVVDRFMQIAEQPNGSTEDRLEAVLNEYQHQKETENPDLLDYAFMVFITHHPKGKFLVEAIPPLLLRQPDKLIPVVDETTGTRASGHAIPPDGLEWFREDPFANEHHEHWHIVYPTSGVPDGRGGAKTKDRQGELFFYMHQQMLARYDAERLALGLERVVPLPRDTALLRQGYDPQELTTINFLTGFSKRNPGKRMQSLLSTGLSYTLDDHELRRQRLTTAINSGNFENPVQMEPQIILKDEEPESPFSDDGNANPNWNDEYNYCTCGWPYHLLIPRGNKKGMPFRLAIVLTDWELDKVGPDSCCGSLSFCGAINQYPDKRPMGYPFDRPFNSNLSLPITDTLMTHQNMALKDISIKWYEADPRSSNQIKLDDQL